MSVFPSLLYPFYSESGFVTGSVPTCVRPEDPARDVTLFLGGPRGNKVFHDLGRTEIPSEEDNTEQKLEQEILIYFQDVLSLELCQKGLSYYESLLNVGDNFMSHRDEVTVSD